MGKDLKGKEPGHSNIGITMNLYVHTTEDEKHKEIEKIVASFKMV